MKGQKFLVVLAVLTLVTAFARVNSHAMDMTQAIQNAKSADDHNALAKHYEDAASEMEIKVQEHKELLRNYDTYGYKYGKQAQDLKTYCRALISAYEQAVNANRKMAKSHRQLTETQ
jgi:endonuclease III